MMNRKMRNGSLMLLLLASSCEQARASQTTTFDAPLRLPSAPPPSPVTVHDVSGAEKRMCSGSTPAGKTAWLRDQPQTGAQLLLHVDTSACKFASTPYYFPRLSCDSPCPSARGGDAPVAGKRDGFDLHVTNTAAAKWTPEDANAAPNRWRIEWLAVGN